ncbi:DUF1304 family protein [Sphingomonas glacialis]|uniref:DUF1304 family protein n=1 Tax=Sphingomonas glacialis TaxID=658225 RepID=A0A502FSD4_9SPHN|nr:DUF1304 family protein [Sphingomonas glacialis]TPG52056.1 DUF1304 family protein [Sphingomonas glacialis]
MTNAARLLTCIMIATYFGFFMVEAVLWTVPWVNAILLPQLNPDLRYAPHMQVEILRALFLNQGAYNLLLAVGGLLGLRLWAHGDVRAGRILLRFIALFAIGAAITLLATTHAYLLGAVQLLVPAALLPLLRRELATSCAAGSPAE